MEEGSTSDRGLGNEQLSKRISGPSKPTVDTIRRQLERILASEGFARAERMSRFLRFIVEQTLLGRGDQLKEYVIGVEVFDRKGSFDPRTDPVVRGEARRLRSKLKEYYDAEGQNDLLRVVLAKGSYVPRFENASFTKPAFETTTAPAAAMYRPKAIAVLPFINLSADNENEYFSDGLTEEIIHALGKVKGMSVVARTSVFQFKGRAYDIRKLGEQLNVQTVLEGSVRKAGERLRITAQLINVLDGYHLWSETYERKMEDVFAIQEEISNAIVNALKPICQEELPLVRRAYENLEAYHLFLKGRFHSRKRTEEGLKRAIEFFHQATEIDPDYAAAYAGLAESFSLLAHKGLFWPRDVMPKARNAALKAIALDDQVSEAHMALGFVESAYDWEWEKAEHHYQQALQVASYGNAEAHHWYSSDYLAPLGRLDEALEQIQHAQFVDPLSHLINSSLGFVLIMRREYDRTIDHYRKCLELDPSYYHFYTGLGRAYAQQGMLEKALDFFLKGKELSGDLPYITGVIAHCHAMMGRFSQAEKLLGELLLLAQERYIPSSTLALVYSGLNKMDEAFRWLERAFAERESSLVYLNVYPTYDILRQDPRFHALVGRMGLLPASPLHHP